MTEKTREMCMIEGMLENRARVRYLGFITVFLFSCLLGSSLQANGRKQEANCTVLETDGYLEFLQCSGKYQYHFTEKAIKGSQIRLKYSRVLTALIIDDSKEVRHIIPELLPCKKDRCNFLSEVYKVRDSKLWADGNRYIAYEILLDYETFGNCGFSLANKAVAENARNCRMERLDILFVMEFACSARPEAAPTLHLIADCDLKSGEYGRLALVSSVGLARIGRLGEAQLLITEDEERAKGDKDFMNECVQTRKLIANIPPKWSDLYARLEEIFL